MQRKSVPFDKVLLVDFDGVINSASGGMNDALMDWYEQELEKLGSSPTPQAKIDLDIKFRIKQSEALIQDAELLKLIFKELRAVGVHCIIASQRNRFFDTAKYPGAFESGLAEDMRKKLHDANLTHLLHLEEGKSLVSDIARESKENDKVLMGKKVCEIYNIAPKNVWLADDNFDYEKPMQDAGFNYHNLDTGKDYAKGFNKWFGLMQKLGVPQNRIDHILKIKNTLPKAAVLPKPSVLVKQQYPYSIPAFQPATRNTMIADATKFGYTAGALVGGVLGSIIPIPLLGTAAGVLLGGIAGFIVGGVMGVIGGAIAEIAQRWSKSNMSNTHANDVDPKEAACKKPVFDALQVQKGLGLAKRDDLDYDSLSSDQAETPESSSGQPKCTPSITGSPVFSASIVNNEGEDDEVNEHDWHEDVGLKR